MNPNNFTHEIDAVYSRVEKLNRQTDAAGPSSTNLLEQAFAELNTTLEEMRVAEEELRQQNEELIFSRYAVEAARERYRDLFEFAPDGYLVTSLQGVVEEANRAAARLLGISQRLLLGKPFVTFVEDDQRREYRSLLARLTQEDRVQDWNVRIKPRHGAAFEATLTVVVVHSREGSPAGLRWMLRDITERKNAEAQVRALNADLEQRVQERTAELEAALQREHRIAETLQRSLLLKPSTDAFAGLAIEMVYQPALQEARVGGDFFDAFALEGGRVAFVVADASGKGLAAAARTVEVKYALRAFLREYPYPARALSRLNDFVCEAQRLEERSEVEFVTLALAVVDTATGELTYASAGAEPALLLRSDGPVEIVEIGGLVLGIESEIEYAATTCRLGSGDTLLIATDGVTEARRGRRLLGVEGMARLADRREPGATLPEIGQAVVSGAHAFAGGALGDDVCLLLARRL